jgi:integrase
MEGQWTDSPYVFISVATGGPIQPGVIYDRFKAVAKAAGISARLHDLRHSCASYLAARGYDVKRVSVHLGHANTNITLDLYTHLFPGALDNVAENVERLIHGDTDVAMPSRSRRA